MEQSYALKYRRLEENHWWFLGRRDIIFKLIKNYPEDTDILDIGCSGGALMEFLKRQGFRKLRGIDVDEKAITVCRQRGITGVNIADAEKTGFKDQQYEIIIASDILEHIRDEDKALFEWHRILKPNGILIVFVPAFNFLWSTHDNINHHYRRYSKSRLAEKLEKNGFKVERASYWNFCLFFPASLVRLSQKFFLKNNNRLRDQLHEVNQFINRALGYLIRLENKLLSGGINFAFGISVFTIGRKI